jgi:hypothetical protein
MLISLSNITTLKLDAIINSILGALVLNSRYYSGIMGPTLNDPSDWSCICFAGLLDSIFEGIVVCGESDMGSELDFRGLRGDAS